MGETEEERENARREPGEGTIARFAAERKLGAWWCGIV